MKSFVPTLFLSILLFATPSAATEDAHAELTRLLDAFLVGASANDAAMHQRFWAEDLVYTSSAGTRFGKADILAGLQDSEAADAPGPSYSAREVEVRAFDDTAVITFRLLAVQPDRSTQSFLNTGVFRRGPDGWQAVVWQATRAAD